MCVQAYRMYQRALDPPKTGAIGKRQTLASEAFMWGSSQLPVTLVNHQAVSLASHCRILRVFEFI